MITEKEINSFMEMDMPSEQARLVLKKLIEFGKLYANAKPSRESAVKALTQASDLCSTPINNGGEGLQEKFADAEDTKVTNHPKRYLGKSGVEAIDIIEYIVQDMEGGLAFNVGTAVKYLSRLGKKKTTDELEDWKKTLWYISRSLTLLNK